MKRVYTLVKAASVMLLIVLLFTACTKSTATPEKVTEIEKRFTILSTDSANIGSIVIEKETNGEARVILTLDKATVITHEAPYQAKLVSSTLPTAFLEPINASTGVSETYPVTSTNKSLKVSYDALMYMRDLRLFIADGNNIEFAITDIH